MSATVPCPTCPWRLSSRPGGVDIPAFDMCAMRNLACTVGSGDDFRTIMACHYTEDEPIYCVGYLAVEGWSNINVRLAAMRGDVDLNAIADACADIPMFDSFNDMLAESERAIAAVGVGETP